MSNGTPEADFETDFDLEFFLRKARVSTEPGLSITPADWNELLIKSADFLNLDLGALGMEDPRKLNSTLPDNPLYTLPLPANQRDFFIGISMGSFTVERRRIHGFNVPETPDLMVETRTGDPLTRQTLKVVLGNWATSIEDGSRLKMRLPGEEFDFMTARDKNVTFQFLDARSRYAPFLLGLFAVRLPRKDHGFTIPDLDLLGRIHTRFKRYFGFDMGDYYRSPDRKRGLIRMKDQNILMVIATLIREKPVSELPFLDELLNLGQEEIPVESDMKKQEDKPMDANDIIWEELRKKVLRLEQENELRWPSVF